MISFCLCTIVWASSSSLLELCFMLFGFVGLNLMWRVLKDCLLKLNGGNHFHLTENCVSSSDLDDYAAYCVCWVACVFELYVCSLVRCAYFLHFSPSKKCGCSCVFIFFSCRGWTEKGPAPLCEKDVLPPPHPLHPNFADTVLLLK